MGTQQQVIIFLKFINPSSKPTDRVKELASSWISARDPIEITSAYFVLCEEFDTMLIVKGDLKNIYEAVKRLESIENAKCLVEVIFPIHLN